MPIVQRITKIRQLLDGEDIAATALAQDISEKSRSSVPIPPPVNCQRCQSAARVRSFPVPFQVAICGPRDCTEEDAANAYRIGELLAEQGAVVICGGGRGVMAAVAAGVRAKDGMVIGVRPNDSREGASPDLSAVIVTNMGEARNAIIIWSADAVIVVGGSWGTLSELALARRRGGVPVISLGGWQVLDRDGKPVEGIEQVGSAEEAVGAALRAQRC
ncbi:MAG TPA: LOG family protein [Mycobacteriales bacterium]|nr:LOG family protein [Mycobacteriales bacterium]